MTEITDIKKHIEVIDQMMEYLNTHTVNGIPIRPTLEAAKKAMQKQEPEKVKVNDGVNVCPCCGARGVVPWSDGHCVACGQALILEGGGHKDDEDCGSVAFCLRRRTYIDGNSGTCNQTGT